MTKSAKAGATIERCLLAQAAHWFLDGTEPIEDKIYRNAPKNLGAAGDGLRELYIALCTSGATLIGNLQVEWDLYHFEDGVKLSTC